MFECTALDALRVESACLFSEPNHTMLSFMWQNDMLAVIRFVDIALRMSVLREADLPPNPMWLDGVLFSSHHMVRSSISVILVAKKNLDEFKRYCRKY